MEVNWRSKLQYLIVFRRSCHFVSAHEEGRRFLMCLASRWGETPPPTQPPPFPSFHVRITVCWQASSELFKFAQHTLLHPPTPVPDGMLNTRSGSRSLADPLLCRISVGTGRREPERRRRQLPHCVAVSCVALCSQGFTQGGCSWFWSPSPSHTPLGSLQVTLLWKVCSIHSASCLTAEAKLNHWAHVVLTTRCPLIWIDLFVWGKRIGSKRQLGVLLALALVFSSDWTLSEEAGEEAAPRRRPSSAADQTGRGLTVDSLQTPPGGIHAADLTAPSLPPGALIISPERI